jgi:cysteinyl-tRNA synthetase
LQIIKRANERGETDTSLSSRFINEFLLDMTELQCLPPTCEPRVTEHIEHIIELITKVQYCYELKKGQTLCSLFRTCIRYSWWGKDLIFPHHENELAQSRAAYPESEVKCWMHNGFVNKDDKKMANSDNNFFTIRDVSGEHMAPFCLVIMTGFYL